MSQEGLARFLSRVAQDPALQLRLSHCTAVEAAALAAELGEPVSCGDLLRYESRAFAWQLTDAEYELVARLVRTRRHWWQCCWPTMPPTLRQPIMASGITVTSNPDPAQLEQLGVHSWPTWGCEVSRFPWTYDERETCLLLEGDVSVTPDGGEPVRFGAGDLVVFEAGLSCTWEVHAPVRKHYRFG